MNAQPSVLTLACGCQYLGDDCVHICALHHWRSKIRTEHVFPPIPVRMFDWSAVTDDYEPGAPQGFGATEAEAIEDLQDQLEDDEDHFDENGRKLAPGEHLSLDDYLADEADSDAIDGDAIDDPDPLTECCE